MNDEIHEHEHALVVPFVVCKTGGGTLAYTLTGSVVGAISQNGTGIPGLTAITITSTPTLFPPTNPVAVADGDAFAFTPASISSTPAGLTISFQKTLAAG